MTRSISAAALKELFAQNSAHVLLPLATFDHESLPEPIRLVADRKSLGHYPVSGTTGTAQKSAAIQFNALAQVLTVGSPVGMQVDKFSVEMKVKFSDLGTGSFFCLRHAWVPNGWLFGLSSALKAQFGIGDAGGTQHSVFSASTLVADTVYHLIGVYDGAQLTLSINGVDEASHPALVTSTLNTASSITLNWSGGTAGDAVVDDIRYYDRALSAEERLQRFQGVEISDGLICNLPLDEGTGTTAADASGSTNEATLSGITWVPDLYADKVLHLATGQTAKAGDIIKLNSGAGSVQQGVVQSFDAGTLKVVMTLDWALNELQRSEDLTNAYWSKNNLTATVDSLSRLSTLNASCQRTVPAGYFVSGKSYKFTAEAQKKTVGDRLGLRIQSYPNRGGAVFDLAAGTVVGTEAIGAGYASTATIEPLEDGWYRCTVEVVVGDTAATNVLFGPTDSTPAVGSWEGNNSAASDCFIRKLHLRPAENDGVYVKTEGSAVTLPDDTTEYEVVPLNTYTALPFELTLPVDTEEEVPNVQLTVDNVDRTLVSLLRSVQDPPDVAIEVVRVAPDGSVTSEMGPMDFSLLSAQIDGDKVTLKIGYLVDILNEPATKEIFSPPLAPALFA